MAKHITALMIEIAVQSISRKWEKVIAKTEYILWYVFPNRICNLHFTHNDLYSIHDELECTHIHHIIHSTMTACKKKNLHTQSKIRFNFLFRSEKLCAK